MDKKQQEIAARLIERTTLLLEYDTRDECAQILIDSGLSSFDAFLVLTAATMLRDWRMANRPVPQSVKDVSASTASSVGRSERWNP